MKRAELEEYKQEVVSKYDDYLMRTENRGVSYGEIYYIENLNEKGLSLLDKELDGENKDVMRAVADFVGKEIK